MQIDFTKDQFESLIKVIFTTDFWIYSVEPINKKEAENF
jgi:hypothetical protein